ncbi:hypothetical protein EO087_11020 [Dyella sp. M7H15-1]|uniref:hypothetical protein n=1 Tax=Dyella sp. M7H15-1 TaxID=2501295 RepID=UPI001004E625|nr:hypothetical protein [Dyella sp. M7H15-1]QAU24453.1 hypothetical protein EO087_11020 [Dyella sp. M7H15-1]
MKRHALVQPRWLALCVMNALCLGVAPLALAQSTPPVPYTLTWIPNLTGTSDGSAAGVNNAVQAIGSLRNASGTYAAFLFNNGAPAPLELTPLSGTLSSVAAGINSASTAVGTRTLSVAVSRKSSCTITHAFVYTSQMVDQGDRAMLRPQTTARIDIPGWRKPSSFGGACSICWRDLVAAD